MLARADFSLRKEHDREEINSRRFVLTGIQHVNFLNEAYAFEHGTK